MVRIILLCDMYIICCFTVPPNMIRPVEGQEFTITEGSDRSITCTATGYPPPKVVWQNSDGSSLNNPRLASGSEVMSSTGVGNVTSVSVELMVTGAMRGDTGMYTCSATNILNSASRNINIIVECKSFCETMLQVLALESVAFAINWSHWQSNSSLWLLNWSSYCSY